MHRRDNGMVLVKSCDKRRTPLMDCFEASLGKRHRILFSSWVAPLESGNYHLSVKPAHVLRSIGNLSCTLVGIFSRVLISRLSRKNSEQVLKTISTFKGEQSAQ